MDIEFRYLKCITAVGEAGSVGHASRLISLSQPAITRTIQALEKRLGSILFERTHRGMKLTKTGKIIAYRSKRAFDRLDYAEAEIIDRFGAVAMPLAAQKLSRNLHSRKMFLVIRVADFQNEELAAVDLGLSLSVVNKTVREVEKDLGVQLFERTSRGLLLTPIAEVIVRHVKLAVAEIRDATAEVSTIEGTSLGRLTVGTLPQSRTKLVPEAINRLTCEFPQLTVIMEDSSFKRLEPGLRCGDIDLIVGSVRGPLLPKDLTCETLFHDNLVVVVRKDHPLADKKTLSFDELGKYEWIISQKHIPLRAKFDELVERENIRLPSNPIVSSSFSSVRGLLLTSDRLCLKSESQVQYELKSGLLVALPICDDQLTLPIGITKRKDWSPPPAAVRFQEILSEVATHQSSH